MKHYLEKIIIPFVCRKRKEVGLQDTYPVLAIYDGFRGQTTGAIFTLLATHNICAVQILRKLAKISSVKEVKVDVSPSAKWDIIEAWNLIQI